MLGTAFGMGPWPDVRREAHTIRPRDWPLDRLAFRVLVNGQRFDRSAAELDAHARLLRHCDGFLTAELDVQIIERDRHEPASDADARFLVQINHGARTLLARRYDEILDFAYRFTGIVDDRRAEQAANGLVVFGPRTPASGLCSPMVGT